MIGSGVTEMIAEGVTAMGLEGAVADMEHLIHAHPTLPKAFMKRSKRSLERQFIFKVGNKSGPDLFRYPP
jgi:hypothetical protein